MRKSPVPLTHSGEFVRRRGIFFMAASPRGSVGGADFCGCVFDKVQLKVRSQMSFFFIFV